MKLPTNCGPLWRIWPGSEEILRTTLGEACDLYAQREPKGEFVLVVEGAPEPESTLVTKEQAAEMIVQLNGCGVSLSDAAKQVAADTGYKKGELYRMALALQGGEG